MEENKAVAFSKNLQEVLKALHAIEHSKSEDNVEVLQIDRATDFLEAIVISYPCDFTKAFQEAQVDLRALKEATLTIQNKTDGQQPGGYNIFSPRDEMPFANNHDNNQNKFLSCMQKIIQFSSDVRSLIAFYSENQPLIERLEDNEENFTLIATKAFGLK